MKKLLSKVMLIVFAFSMLFTLPTQKVSAAEGVSYNDALEATIQKYMEKYQSGFSSYITGDAWAIIGLARSEKNVPKEIFDTYYSKVEEYVQDKVSNNQKMSGGDLAKLVLSVSAIGQDPRNVAGIDLIDIIWNQDGILNEYYTSLTYVLIALDSKNYEEPQDALNTRNKIIEVLLSKELPNGGFGWGSPEPDSTAMVLQALVKHLDREDVNNTMNRSLKALSELQVETGGYISFGKENSNSVAQIITLLTALGEDPTVAEGFVKGENNVLTNLMSFYTGNGDFKYNHSDINGNGMATEQALYSLVAYDRLVNGKTSLYDMIDVISTTDYLNIVKEVNSRIGALPEAAGISLDNKEEVNSILAKFNSLPEEYKGQVLGLDKLNTASLRISEIQTTVDGINNDIWNNINPENITLNDKEAVLEIVKRYEALSTEDKKYIEGYEEVLVAKEKIEALEKEQAEKEEEDNNESNSNGTNNNGSNGDGSASSNVVQTGDSSNFGYLFIIMLACGAVMIFAMKKKKIKEA